MIIIIQWKLQYNQVPREWENVFLNVGVRYSRVLFQYILVLVALAGLKKIVCYNGDFVIKRFAISGFHCIYYEYYEIS